MGIKKKFVPGGTCCDTDPPIGCFVVPNNSTLVEVSGNFDYNSGGGYWELLSGIGTLETPSGTNGTDPWTVHEEITFVPDGAWAANTRFRVIGGKTDADNYLYMEVHFVPVGSRHRHQIVLGRRSSGVDTELAEHPFEHADLEPTQSASGSTLECQLTLDADSVLTGRVSFSSIFQAQTYIISTRSISQMGTKGGLEVLELAGELYLGIFYLSYASGPHTGSCYSVTQSCMRGNVPSAGFLVEISDPSPVEACACLNCDTGGGGGGIGDTGTAVCGLDCDNIMGTYTASEPNLFFSPGGAHGDASCGFESEPIEEAICDVSCGPGVLGAQCNKSPASEPATASRWVEATMTNFGGGGVRCSIQLYLESTVNDVTVSCVAAEFLTEDTGSVPIDWSDWVTIPRVVQLFTERCHYSSTIQCRIKKV